MNSRDYGMPQPRHRIYFVGIRRRMMRNTDSELALPPRQPPPELEEYLDPPPEGAILKAQLPGSKGADTALLHALSVISTDGYDPWAKPFVVDVDKSEEWRPNHHVPDRVPCLTYSSTRGFWITNRGRRMTPAECLRIQGISTRQTTGLPDGFIRACVGNTMSVQVISALIQSAFPWFRLSNRFP